MDIFCLLLGWALDGGNIFVWVYALLQWNCMTRSINIGTLGLHNVGSANDFWKSNKTKQKLIKQEIKLEYNIYMLTLIIFLFVSIFLLVSILKLKPHVFPELFRYLEKMTREMVVDLEDTAMLGQLHFLSMKNKSGTILSLNMQMSMAREKVQQQKQFLVQHIRHLFY